MEMGNLAAGMAIFLEGHTSELKVSGRIFHTVTSAAGHGRGYALPPATCERRPRAVKKPTSGTSLVAQLSGICPAVQGMCPGSLGGN